MNIIFVPYTNKDVFHQIFRKREVSRWLFDNVGLGAFSQNTNFATNVDWKWSYDWDEKGEYFLFKYKRDAMLFKLTWT